MPMPTYINERPVKTGCWTGREDELLAEWQGRYGNRWCMVAKKISGRTGQQCAQRWRHKVNPDIKKAKWSPEEDERLLILYEEHGGSWAQISRHLEGRTDQQCMGRWKRHLDPSITREAWTDAEDATLHKRYLVHGSQWSSIARSLPGRTAQQCRARWFQVGSGCKIAAKSSSRFRQQREDGSWSDDGTAYQDGLDQDVDLSEDEEDGGAWHMHDDDEDDDESWGMTPPRSSRARAFGKRLSSGHRTSQASAHSRGRRSACQNLNSYHDSPDSAVGSNGYGSRTLEEVEEADIEAGQILTALKSSYSPIRRVEGDRWGKSSPRSIRKVPLSPLRHNSSAASTLGPSEAAEHLQPSGLPGSAPTDSALYSPKPSKACRRDPTGRTGPATADVPAGLAIPQTPRSVSRLAGVSSPGVGVGPWPGARSPSVPIMNLLQSPEAPDSATFLRSPSSFQGLVTPDWSRKLSQPKEDPQTCPPPSQGWTPSTFGGNSRIGVRHTVARRLNVDQALKGAGPLGSGLAPLTVPQSLPEVEGQGSGTGNTGQDVGSPAKKMRTASGFAHGRDADDSAKARLQHYIAARQQNSFGQSSEADSTTFVSGSSIAHQLYIQPLCLTGSPTASSSPGIASSGNPSVSAGYGPSPSGLSGAAAHAHFFLPGFRAGLEPGPGQEGRGQLGGALGSKQLSKLSSVGGFPPDVVQLLEGAVAARARLEPYRRLTDKENSACLAFNDMTMSRPGYSSLPGAASGLRESVSGSEESDAAEQPAEPSHGHAELHSNAAPPSVGSNRVKVASGLEGMHYRIAESEGTQARSAARRVKLHAMLENL